MGEKITIQQAIGIWEKGQTRSLKKTDIHPSDQLIRRLAMGLESDADRWFDHLADCPACRDKWLEEMTREPEAADHTDLFFARVAGGEKSFENVTRISSDSGKYQITFRKKKGDRDAVLVTLDVLRGAGELEGRRVVVRDKNKKKLLDGKIIQGSLSRPRKGLDDVDLSVVSVIPDE